MGRIILLPSSDQQIRKRYHRFNESASRMAVLVTVPDQGPVETSRVEIEYPNLSMLGTKRIRKDILSEG